MSEERAPEAQTETKGAPWFAGLVFLAVIIGAPLYEFSHGVFPGSRLKEVPPTEDIVKGRAARKIEEDLKNDSILIKQLRPGYTELIYKATKVHNKKVIVGRNDWLFLRGSMDVVPREFPEAEIRSLATLYRQVADLLAQRGTHLIVAMIPSKATVHPEKLPRERSDYRSHYAAILKEFQAAGVNAPDLLPVYRRPGKLLFYPKRHAPQPRGCAPAGRRAAGRDGRPQGIGARSTGPGSDPRGAEDPPRRPPAPLGLRRRLGDGPSLRRGAHRRHPLRRGHAEAPRGAALGSGDPRGDELQPRQHPARPALPPRREGDRRSLPALGSASSLAPRRTPRRAGRRQGARSRVRPLRIPGALPVPVARRVRRSNPPLCRAPSARGAFHRSGREPPRPQRRGTPRGDAHPGPRQEARLARGSREGRPHLPHQLRSVDRGPMGRRRSPLRSPARPGPRPRSGGTRATAGLATGRSAMSSAATRARSTSSTSSRAAAPSAGSASTR